MSLPACCPLLPFRETHKVAIFGQKRAFKPVRMATAFALFQLQLAFVPDEWAVDRSGTIDSTIFTPFIHTIEGN